MASAKKCCHYWIIETPEGPESTGVCRKCGAVRNFMNGTPDGASVWKPFGTDKTKATRHMNYGKKIFPQIAKNHQPAY